MAARKKTARKKAAPARAKKSKATRKRKTARKTGGAGSAKPARKATRKTRAAKSLPVFPEVEALVKLMKQHNLDELDYHLAPDGTKQIRIARLGGGGGSWVPSAPAAAPAAGGAAPAEPAPAAPVADEPLHAFKSPMVGTFYRAPSPEASAFASVGDSVDENSTVCIIEAMKVMNEISPDIRGEVVSIEVENGEAVEYGQTLFLIRPA